MDWQRQKASVCKQRQHRAITGESLYTRTQIPLFAHPAAPFVHAPAVPSSSCARACVQLAWVGTDSFKAGRSASAEQGSGAALQVAWLVNFSHQDAHTQGVHYINAQGWMNSLKRPQDVYYWQGQCEDHALTDCMTGLEFSRADGILFVVSTPHHLEPWMSFSGGVHRCSRRCLLILTALTPSWCAPSSSS